MTDEMDEPARAAEEEPRRRFSARDDRLCCAAPAGVEVGGLTGAGFGEKSPEAAGPAQRLSRTRLGDARRHGRAAHPKAAQGQLFPGLSRAAPHGGEGADGGDRGGLYPGHLDPLGRRVGQGDGDERHLKEPGVSPLRRDRRGQALLSRPIEGDWPCLWINAAYLKVRQAGRIVSVTVDRRGRRQRRWPARSAGHGISIPPGPRPSGPPSCASWRGAGCAGVKLVVSDSHEASRAPTRRSSPRTCHSETPRWAATCGISCDQMRSQSWRRVRSEVMAKPKSSRRVAFGVLSQSDFRETKKNPRLPRGCSLAGSRYSTSGRQLHASRACVICKGAIHVNSN
jgi:putative transposase